MIFQRQTAYSRGRFLTQKMEAAAVRISCVARLRFPPVAYAADHFSAVAFLRAPARPAGLTPKSDAGREQVNTVIGDATGAILQTDDYPIMKSARVRNWRPISFAEWMALSPDSY